MKGTHHIIVQNGSLKYEFDLKRNITILKGNSATGKTTLIEMVQEYLVDGADSGINLSCDVECRVLTGNLWKEQLANVSHAIVFIDEGNRFVRTEEFVEKIKKSDNYYVIVTRESLEMLPISVTEIYGIRSSGKYGGLVPVYHEFYHIYGDEIRNKKNLYPICPEILLVEDSNAGYEFFSSVAREKGIQCISANGKSNIFNFLIKNKNELKKETLIIADGAAFGSQMNRLEQILKQNNLLHLYLPESFEWILLKSGLIRGSNIAEILDDTAEYVESREYFSWEQFFTAVLIQASKDSYLKYSKKKINKNYLKPFVKKRILEVMEGITIQNKNKTEFF